MKELDELICLLAEGNITPEERMTLLGQIEKHPEILDEIRSVLGGTNSMKTDFESDSESTVSPDAFLINQAATFCVQKPVYKGIIKFGNKNTCDVGKNVRNLLLEIDSLE